MKVKCLVSFSHDGEKRINEEFDCSEQTAKQLAGKGLVEIVLSKPKAKAKAKKK